MVSSPQRLVALVPIPQCMPHTFPSSGQMPHSCKCRTVLPNNLLSDINRNKGKEKFTSFCLPIKYTMLNRCLSTASKLSKTDCLVKFCNPGLILLQQTVQQTACSRHRQFVHRTWPVKSPQNVLRQQATKPFPAQFNRHP